MKNILIGLCGFFLTACSVTGSINTTNSAANNSNTTVNSANTVNVNTSTNAANTAANVDKNGNANAAKPADAGPTRISFGKDQTSAAENMVLAPGQSKKFVISAKADQFLTVESSAKEAKIVMITKGKSTEADNEAGLYSATLDKDGDFIFEVSNPTKTEFKTSINVSVSEEGND